MKRGGRMRRVCHRSTSAAWIGTLIKGSTKTQSMDHHCFLYQQQNLKYFRPCFTATLLPVEKEQVRAHSTQSPVGHANPCREEALKIVERLQTNPQLTKEVAQHMDDKVLEDIAQLKVQLRNEPYQPLTYSQLVKLFIRSSAPFFGFGVCDNIIMISVGDLVDQHFGVTMGFSTMIAAGFGQAFSDGSGVTIQTLIERWSDRLGLPNPGLTEAQRSATKVQWIIQAFRTIGIMFGCLVGLVPVILFDTGNTPRLSDMLLKNTLPVEKRQILSSYATRCSFSPGNVICKFGEEIDALYTIIGGEVKVIGRDDDGLEIELCTQSPGHVIGALELVFGHPCCADVVAIGRVDTLRISKEVFKKYVSIEEGKKTLQEYISHDETFLPYRLRHFAKKKEEVQ